MSESSAVRPVAHLTLSIGDGPDRAGEAARRWLGDTFARLSGQLGAFVRGASAPEVDWRDFEPFHVRAGVGVSGGRGGDWMRTYTPSNWQSLMDQLAEFPETGALEIVANDELGRPGGAWFDTAVYRRGADWLLLTTDIDRDLLDDGPGQATVLDTLRSVAEMANPSSGLVFPPRGVLQTPREFELNVYTSKTVPRSRSVLRDYGWLTIVAQELGDRLGGLPALRDSGVFHEAAQLGAGGYWLLATERRQDFGPGQEARAAELFAPILKGD